MNYIQNAITMVENFYQSIPNAISLYLRGSASTQVRKYAPWDIDFVIVLPKSSFDKEKFSNFIQTTNNLLLPNPTLDISFIHNDSLMDSKYLHSLLLLKDDARLILGDEMDFTPIKSISTQQKYEILKFYLDKSEKRLIDLDKNTYPSVIYIEKSRRLAKLLSRTANIFYYIETNVFTRNPNIGIHFISEEISDDFSLFLLNGLKYGISTDKLIIARNLFGLFVKKYENLLND